MVGIAQLVERLVVVEEVAGSSPVTHPSLDPCEHAKVHRDLLTWLCSLDFDRNHAVANVQERTTKTGVKTYRVDYYDDFGKFKYTTTLRDWSPDSSPSKSLMGPSQHKNEKPNAHGCHDSATSH